MNAQDLKAPIEYLKGVGPARADLLRTELNIHSFQDLLSLFPYRYIDRTQFYKISALQNTNAEVQIIGKITAVKMVPQKRGKRMVAVFEDETGQMELVWFQGHKWIRENIKTNTPYLAFGKLKWFGNKPSMPHPELDLLEDFEKKKAQRMQPVYPSTEKLQKRGLTNRKMNTMTFNLLKQCTKGFTETLPEEIREKHKLVSKTKAIFDVHFPASVQDLERARFRLKFEEFFYVQLQLIRRNLVAKHKIKGFPFPEVGDYFMDFYKNHLPFELTHAQKRVLKEIRKDLRSNAQMNRLLQGDVGSGKTIVGFLSMLIAIGNGYQACMMAPTEILAIQHFEGISELAEKVGLNVKLLTGSTKTKERRLLHEELASGELHILIGTHALIEDKVKFKNLGLAIIDEQHRFGVAQRAKLWKKNSLPPHVMVMTATPIPRTLAMSVYGDLDISVIDELPPGRKPIKTVHRYDANRLKVFKFLKDELTKGRQAYVVYPLIEESDNFDYKDLMDGYESIVRYFPKPDYQVSIVHGKMKPEDKAFEMQRFVEGKTQIMVATTVIEVGVNVPNASIMLIESAERFGLSQLHQLRGRVGRGAEQSYCVLLTGHKLSKDGKTRLETMTQTNDGFKIAEVDLKLRGPGDLMGTQQSGVLQLKIADLVQDGSILALARKEAHVLLKEDPKMLLPKNSMVNFTYQTNMKNKQLWNYIS
ncbi:ATP-dependent DNA helicase RecG [Psychroflexus planctonicus]|uniref:ATP-dependent DNA helicase RecG n=1 Tax=Psychroflexus planctonicus TaxID=1526575 RepID=A0ABQ1SHR5_9FLAO|nr:ATP-dependent DNA helicase RecG [Psychroflexus planctonicus]GGE35568.1 ATP-dependent DNA helicase RecG [Psychroflexus planctonicus]